MIHLEDLNKSRAAQGLPPILVEGDQGAVTPAPTPKATKTPKGWATRRRRLKRRRMTFVVMMVLRIVLVVVLGFFSALLTLMIGSGHRR